MIRFRCPCGKKLKADESIIGKKVKCSDCNKINTVPAQSTATSRKEKQQRLHAEPKDHGQLTPPPTQSANATSSNLDRQTALKQDSHPETHSHSNDKRKRLEFRKPKSGVPAPKPSILRPPSGTDAQSQAGDSRTNNSQFGDSKAPPQHSAPVFGHESSNSKPDVISSPRSEKSSVSDRFKLAPEFDPDPSDDLISASDSFDFDPSKIDYADTSSSLSPALSQPDSAKPDSSKLPASRKRPVPDSTADTDPTRPSPNQQGSPSLPPGSSSESSTSLVPPTILPHDELQIDTGFEAKFRVKQPTANKNTLLYFLLGLGGLVGITALVFLTIWMMSGPPTYPDAFQAMSEYKDFQRAIVSYEKARRMYFVSGEGYIQSMSPDQQEVQSFRQFYEDSAVPQRAETLGKALDLYEDNQVEQAKTFLREQASQLNQKRPEIETRAIELSNKSR